MSQVQSVLKHLRENDHITPMQALLVYKIPRLAARIFDIRQSGVEVQSSVAFDSLGSEYTRYSIKGYV